MSVSFKMLLLWCLVVLLFFNEQTHYTVVAMDKELLSQKLHHQAQISNSIVTTHRMVDIANKHRNRSREALAFAQKKKVTIQKMIDLQSSVLFEISLLVSEVFSHDYNIDPWFQDYKTILESYNLMQFQEGRLSATRETLGANLSGSEKYAGGVLGIDGKIYGIPYNAHDILIIDPQTQTATRSTMGLSLSDAAKWVGGVLGPDGKIYGIPFHAQNILIIDTVTQTATRKNFGLSLSDLSKWVGGVLGPDGKIYAIPFSAPDILIIDPIIQTAIRTDMSVSLAGHAKWIGGVLSQDGRIFSIPYESQNIIVIDPFKQTISTMNLGLTGNMKWYGGVLGFNGKIYGIPHHSSDILIIDPMSQTATRSKLNAPISGSTGVWSTGQWRGGVVGPDGKIYSCPWSANSILVIDPNTETATTTQMGLNLSGTNKFIGCNLGLDGKIYGIPFDSNNILIISNNVTLPHHIPTSPLLNKF